MSVTSSGSRVQGASSMLIAQLARSTRRRIEQAIAPTGLRPTELLVLQHLRERGPSAQQTLTELIGIDATNLVAVLNSLEDQSLIERRRDRADRRRAIIALSPPGEHVLADLDLSLLRVDDQILAPLTGTERQTLHALLAKAIKHIGPECPPPPGQGC
jgi:MarR family transcriptional regulator, lower aerobic nicotinate degradation pathway regulator